MNFQINDKPYPHDSRTKEVLMGCADFVRKDGLNYLVPKWKSYTALYLNGYTIDETIYEFLNDPDTRYLIHKIIMVLDKDEREEIKKELELYDSNFVNRTVELKECVWGKKMKMITTTIGLTIGTTTEHHKILLTANRNLKRNKYAICK